MKHKGLFFTLLGIVCILSISAVGLFFGGYKKSGEHSLKNSPGKLKDVLYFKNGNIYFYSGGENRLIAENVYDASSDEPAYTADYAVDAKTGRMIYVSQKQLYFFDGNSSKLICANVLSWASADGMDSIAFTTQWNSSKTKCNLFFYKDGVTVPVDSEVTLSSVRFSQNGERLFYQKENVYPKTQYKLFCFFNGKSELKASQTAHIMWVSDTGDAVLTGESFDDSLYIYTLFTKDFKKKSIFENIYFSGVSEDKSTIYLLKDYDSENKKGTLASVKVSNGSIRTIDSDVSFFTLESVTDSSQGVVYSKIGQNELYEIYYSTVSGKRVRLLHNADEDAMYSIAVNTQADTGYVISQKSKKTDNELFFVKWSGSKVDSKRLDAGYIEGLTYFEASDTVTYIKNPESDSPLYMLADNDKASVIENCAAVYDSSVQGYYCRGTLSDSARNALFFSSLNSGETANELWGTLAIKTADGVSVISENVSSESFSAPITDAEISKIFYCVRKENGFFDLYLFQNGKNELLCENIHATAAITYE